MAEKIRAHALISGRVQGVCFRLETQQAAKKYGVFGWVRNRRDGSVEAVFEGSEEQVNSILEFITVRFFAKIYIIIKLLGLEYENLPEFLYHDPKSNQAISDRLGTNSDRIGRDGG